MTSLRTGACAGALAMLLALGASACSSAPSSGGTTTSSTSAATTTSLSPAASKSAIKHAFSTLFNLANPAVAPKLAVIQDGQTLKATITKELKSALAKKAGGADVTAVALKSGSACSAETLTSPCALVTYNIVSPAHAVLLAHSKGFAVYVSQKWLVSKATICTLLTLANGNVRPSGC